MVAARLRARQMLACRAGPTLVALALTLSIVVGTMAAVAHTAVNTVERQIALACAVDALAVAVAVGRAVNDFAAKAGITGWVLRGGGLAHALAPCTYTTLLTTAVIGAANLVARIAAEARGALAVIVGTADAVARAVLGAARRIACFTCPWARAVARTRGHIAHTVAGTRLRALADRAVAARVSVTAVARALVAEAVQAAILRALEERA